MWLYYLLLTVGATKAVLGQDSQISISGTGTMNKSGKTSLNIQVEIEGLGAGTKTGWGGGGGWGGGQGGGQGGWGGGQGGGGGGWGGGQGGGGGGASTQEEEVGLGMHNEFRQIHQVPAMKLDRKMCDEAKSYAQKLAQMGTLQHSSSSERNGQGENLSMGCSTDKAQTMEEAVTNWYNEVCEPGYNFNNGGFNGGTGHFTQVVWKASTVLGIGRAETTKNGMKCAYIVGRYKPAGNMGGKFQQNVLKGSFDESYCNSVSNSGWKKKFLDEQGRPLTLPPPLLVNASSDRTGPAEFRGQKLWILKHKKKTTVARKGN